jgi:hypothetical protein
MALNFTQTGPAGTVKAALDALEGLSDAEVIVRGHASDQLGTCEPEAVVEVVVQLEGWRVTPTT